MEYKETRIQVNQPLPTPTRRDQAQMALYLDAVMRRNTAAMFGVPITHERAMADARAALSEADRVLLARDAEVVERLLPNESTPHE